MEKLTENEENEENGHAIMMFLLFFTTLWQQLFLCGCCGCQW